MGSSLADDVVRVVAELDARGLNRGSTGNCSTKWDAETFLITPSGIASRDVTRESLVKVRYDETGESVESQMYNQRYRASSEWRFHRDIYRSRADVSAVVHVHSTYATSLACTGRGIPAFHYMIAIAGGDDVRCARYATYGTQELSDNVINALDGRRACLIENHGMLAIGRSLSDALATAVEVESLAEQYAISLLLGGPRILSDKEMASVHTKFAAYRRLGEQEQS